jgi:hypothetical protein
MKYFEVMKHTWLQVRPPSTPQLRCAIEEIKIGEDVARNEREKVAIKAPEISAPCSEDGLKLFDVRIDIKGRLIFL